MTKWQKKLTAQQMTVLRLAEAGNVWAHMDASRNGGRGRTVSSLRALDLIDWKHCLTGKGRLALKNGHAP